MNIPKPFIQTPLCHRCKRPMVFYAQEIVGSAVINIFRCETCDTLEAVEGPSRRKPALLPEAQVHWGAPSSGAIAKVSAAIGKLSVISTSGPRWHFAPRLVAETAV
jgi:hypothetical protein